VHCYKYLETLEWNTRDGSPEFLNNVQGKVGFIMRYKLRTQFILIAVLFLGMLVLLESCNTNSSNPLNPQTPITVTVESRIALSTDDAEEYNTGAVTRSSTKLELVTSSISVQTVGLRFPGLALPKNAAISKAYIQFKTASSSSDVTSLTLQGQASDNAATFGSTSLNVSSRPRTTASVAWSPVTWSVVGQAGPDQQTLDLTAIVQEIVNRPGWNSGNALAVIITGSGKRVAWAFDGDNAGAPLLHVEYVTDDSPPVINSFSDTPDPGDANVPQTFNWSISDPDSQIINCQLDINNDGFADYIIPNCDTVTSQEHTYTVPGNYTAKLTATDSDNVSSSATTSVVIGITVTIAAAGDIACNPFNNSKFNGGLGTSTYCHMLQVSDSIIATNPEIVLALGDNQYEEGTLAQYQNSYDLSWGRFKNITRPVVGNHEYLTTGAAGHFAYYGSLAGDPTKGYYSFNVGNWHLIALNSNCSKVGGCGVGSLQETWLRADLAAHPTVCTLAYWHHARFSSGAIGNNTAMIPFWNALYNAGAELVLVGHDHHYERFAPQTSSGVADPNGIREFVVGVGGKAPTGTPTVQPNSETRVTNLYGFLKLDLHPTSYDWEFVVEPNRGYSFTDSGSAACH
jgi:acid phosphatase type 7